MVLRQSKPSIMICSQMALWSGQDFDAVKQVILMGELRVIDFLWTFLGIGIIRDTLVAFYVIFYIWLCFCKWTKNAPEGRDFFLDSELYTIYFCLLEYYVINLPTYLPPGQYYEIITFRGYLPTYPQDSQNPNYVIMERSLIGPNNTSLHDSTRRIGRSTPIKSS